MKSGDLVDGRFQLTAQVGSGAFGDVWRALDLTSGLDVALKVLTAADDDARARFDIEARVIQQVSNPFCVRPIGSGRLEDGTPFLVTEFIDGETLGDWLKRPTSVPDRLSVAMDIATALKAIHRAGIVHRDLKPANIIVRRVAEQWVPVVLDFGIAKVTGRRDHDITATGVAIGTPGYMSPEQLRGQRNVGAPTDMYALGVILFEMFEGHPPFGGRSPMEIAMQHLAQPIPPITARMPPRLAPIVSRLLSKSPDRRPTASAVLAELQGPATSEAEHDVPTRTLHHALFGALVAVVVLSVVVALLLRDESVEPTVDRKRQVRLSALLKPSEELRAPVIETDSGSTDADIAPEPPPLAECADLLPWEPGVHRSPLYDDTWVRLPPGYTRSRKYPVILAFHDSYQTAHSGVNLLSEHALANASRDYIVVAAKGPDVDQVAGHWANDSGNERALEHMQQTIKEFCIDRQQLYGIAYAVGSTAMLRAGCFGTELRAVASFASRFTDGGYHRVAKCLKKQRRPLLMISPSDDPFAPIDGTKSCNGSAVLAESEQVQRMRGFHGCKSQPKTTTVQGGTCSAHACKVDLQTCVVSGGHAWPGGAGHDRNMEALGRLLKGCGREPATTFDVSGQILEFFEKHRSPESPE